MTQHEQQHFKLGFYMNKLTLLVTVLSIISPPLFAADNHAHEEDHKESTHHELEENDEHNHNGAEGLTIAQQVIDESNIGIKKSASGVIHQTITTYGLINADTNSLSHVQARYSGEIKKIQKNIGDFVAKGEFLARIESSDSLQAYTITAPLSGQIIQKHANLGEITSDKPLFIIANFETLWAELKIFPKNQDDVKPNQKVTLKYNGESIESEIAHVIPQLGSPYLTARVPFKNYLKITPGIFIEADIATALETVPVRVEKVALQTLNDQQGIFIQKNNEYVFTPVVTGAFDQKFIEIKQGIKPGAYYASDNSYLLLAELQKSEAGHSH